MAEKKSTKKQTNPKRDELSEGNAAYCKLIEKNIKKSAGTKKK